MVNSTHPVILPSGKKLPVFPGPQGWPGRFGSKKKNPRRKRNHDFSVFHPVTEELYLLRYRTVLFHALGFA